MISRGVVSVLLIGCCCALGENYPFVSTSLGNITGVYEESYSDRIYSAFYSIPFAKPPVGELRFQEPQPISSWSGTWNASIKDIFCVQVVHTMKPGGDYIGDEDCLYLSVFVPNEDPGSIKEPLDVIVHVHGGAFMFGSANSYAGPAFLMDRDVILVTISYRLGVLGFLSTEDGVVPGNNGMKDQVLALKWIRDHIKSFGGNPESVTLTGLSAGGASVHLHYLSPLSRGLFARGVSFSGNALAPWVLQEEPLLKARMLGAQVGCAQQETKELVNCLKQRSTYQLVESVKILRPWLFNPFSPFGVVVEKGGDNRFLEEHPYLLLKNGKFYDVPWIISSTAEEGLYPAAEFATDHNYFKDLEERWLELAPFVLDYNYTVAAGKKDDVSKKIKRAYLKKKRISSETFRVFVDMMSDRLFCISAEIAAKMHAFQARSPVYFYYFAYLGDEIESFSIHFTKEDQRDGVSHGDDVMYIFSNPQTPIIPRLPHLDELMKEKLLNMLTSFSSTNVPHMSKVDWEPVGKRDPVKMLYIRNPKDMSMEKITKIERHRSMWASIPFAENEGLFPTAKDEL
nr:carboxylesterase [Holotrichia parallela]